MLRVEVQSSDTCFVETVIFCINLDLRAWVRGGPLPGGVHFCLNIFKTVIWERTVLLLQSFTRLDVPTLVSLLGILAGTNLGFLKKEPSDLVLAVSSCGPRE